MGCHALLQATFPTQGLKPAVLHSGRTLYRLSHQGNRRKQLSTPGRGALDVEKQVSTPERAHATCTHGGRSSSARGALVSFSQIRGGVSTRLPSFWPLPVSLACLGFTFPDCDTYGSFGKCRLVHINFSIHQAGKQHRMYTQGHLHISLKFISLSFKGDLNYNVYSTSSLEPSYLSVSRVFSSFTGYFYQAVPLKEAQNAL